MSRILYYIFKHVWLAFKCKWFLYGLYGRRPCMLNNSIDNILCNLVRSVRQSLWSIYSLRGNKSYMSKKRANKVSRVFCYTRYTTTFLLCFLHELQYQWVLQVQYVTTSESCTNEFTSSVTKSPKRSSAKTHNSFKDMSSNQSSLADAICKKMYKKFVLKKKPIFYIFSQGDV